MPTHDSTPTNGPFPIEHPEFRYPVSKHPYLGRIDGVRERLEIDQSTETFKGRWRERFLDFQEAGRASLERPLHVEIGCNGGHVILEWASRDPSAAYIGIDWKLKQIVLACEKAQKRSLRNILFLKAHAVRTGFIFNDAEIDSLSLYFPDPWPKKSQKKNRIVTPTWLRHIHRILKPGGFFHIKTDHAEYFDWMQEAIAATSPLWRVEELTHDLHGGNSSARALRIPDVTLFERLFIKDGVSIHSVKLFKA